MNVSFHEDHSKVDTVIFNASQLREYLLFNTFVLLSVKIELISQITC